MNSSLSIAPLLWFAAIIVAIPLVLWLLKRTPLGGSGAAEVMRSVAALPLSTSQRILTIEVGQGDQRRWLVVGVTPHSITTLHTMDAPPVDAARAATPTPASSAAASFSQMLGRLQGSRSGGEHAS
jgi:flagellar protein FliO/FliZ